MYSISRFLFGILGLAALFTFTGCEKDTAGPEDQLCWVWIDGTFEYLKVNQMPEYKDGGEDNFNKALLQTIKYPAPARENHIQGRVITSYEITEDGYVENIQTVEGIGWGCDEAVIVALEDVTTGQSFSPAIYQGNPVRVRKECSIQFKLE